MDELSALVIGAGVEVHRNLGPGFVESVYEKAMLVELAARGVAFEAQVPVGVFYKGHQVGTHRLDLIVAGRLVVELKSVSDIHKAHRAQLRSYLAATNCPVGLLLNFNRPTLQIRRIEP